MAESVSPVCISGSHRFNQRICSQHPTSVHTSAAAPERHARAVRTHRAFTSSRSIFMDGSPPEAAKACNSPSALCRPPIFVACERSIRATKKKSALNVERAINSFLNLTASLLFSERMQRGEIIASRTRAARNSQPCVTQNFPNAPTSDITRMSPPWRGRAIAVLFYASAHEGFGATSLPQQIPVKALRT